MCDPVSIGVITMATLSMASTGMGIKAQNYQANVAAESASNAASADYQASEAEAAQLNANANQEALKMKREALIERGRLVSAQSEAGFLGNSPLRELLNQRLKETEALGTIDYNQANVLAQNFRERGKTYATSLSRYNEAKANYVGGWASGLMIASAGAAGGVQGYQLGKAIKSPKGGRA